MSKIEVNQISSQCGSTLTIGQSGDTVTLACGATQSGFGRTGTVDWDTTAKTAGFTAVSGNGYFVNTTSGAITVTLPATPSAGDIVSIADYAGTAATNNITIARNGSNFEGGTANGQIATNRQSVTLIYVDGTQGWVPTSENDSSFQQPLFVTATGGTVTCCGNYKIHTFTGPGTFCVSCAGNSVGSNKIDYLVIAGGGGGGFSNGGGGGAGGYRESHCSATSGCYTASPLATPTSLPVSATAYPITVGGGGAGGTPSPFTSGCSGSNSVFSTITSAGGSGGGTASAPGGSGGSGGGGGNGGNAGTGNTPPVSPPQGNNGGSASTSGPTAFAAAGGGGAGSVGSNACGSSNGGPGGNGVTSSINASPVTRAGGGGGAVDPGFTGGSGGPGCGGDGGDNSGGNGTAGGTNKGSGGGGGTTHGSGTVGGAGGSGIVIIRYKYQ